MVRMDISKEAKFEYAHRLHNYPGPCANIHGHSGRLIVTISGEVKEDGMVVDFKWLDKVIDDAIVKRLDHQFLNELGLADLQFLPTAERLCIFIWRALSRHLNSIERKFGSDLRLEKVQFWETETSSALLTKEHWSDAIKKKQEERYAIKSE